MQSPIQHVVSNVVLNSLIPPGFVQVMENLESHGI